MAPPLKSFVFTKQNYGRLSSLVNDFHTRGHKQNGLPIYSSVIYLRPNAGRRDPGRYIQEISGHLFVSQYKVIRLIERD